MRELAEQRGVLSGGCLPGFFAFFSFFSFFSFVTALFFFSSVDAAVSTFMGAAGCGLSS